jgi:GAF domain-containing protein
VLSDTHLTESLAALSRFFVGDGTLEETLQRVADLTVDAIDPADFAGVTMMVEGHHRTGVYTDELSPAIDETQYETGSGPCVEAFATGETKVITSTIEDGRWPEFRHAAAEHGILSTLSLPMIANKAPVGAMNLYSRREHGFSETDDKVGSVFATQAAMVLANAQAYWDSRELSVRLGDAMAARSVIEQAKGMIMAMQGCDEDEAFHMLVAASQRENVKLRDVAQRIVTDAVARGRKRRHTT